MAATAGSAYLEVDMDSMVIDGRLDAMVTGIFAGDPKLDIPGDGKGSPTGRMLCPFVSSCSISANVRRLEGRPLVTPFCGLWNGDKLLGDLGEIDFDCLGRGDNAVKSPT